MANMDRRLELSDILHEVVDNVYFEPPASVKMKYPCIRYSRSHIDAVYADNIPYLRHKRWELILIYEDADSDLPDQLLEHITAAHDRHYVADNLHHDVFTTYF